MPTLKLRLDDLQVTSFTTSPADATRGTVVAHDVKAPGTGAEMTCQFWTCNGCPTGIQTHCDCDTQYLSCGVSCQSCVESCGALDTCDAMATCLQYPSCADTCWDTCFRCPVP